ncbi:hypothetical protein F2Q70_00018352 [Brassica cretica]|uniref:Secreted protein n=1 Tax=Brassica cretica TaxID=69181 RepID=A0A8S9HS23_BRACR|nr:hypothetical protein F2Q70_00018352 [Brassica cretica]
MAGRMLQLHARRHLVLLHVRLHVQLPCTATPRASGDTQLVRWLTPRSEPMQRATSSFSVHWPDVGPSATDRSEYDDQNTDEPSSVITQLPHMHAVRSLRSDRARAKLGRYIVTELEPSSVAGSV